MATSVSGLQGRTTVLNASLVSLANTVSSLGGGLQALSTSCQASARTSVP